MLFPAPQQLSRIQDICDLVLKRQWQQENKENSWKNISANVWDDVKCYFIISGEGGS